MKNVSVLFLAGVLCVTALSASATEYYTGDYKWLRFWDTTVTTSGYSWSNWNSLAWLDTATATGDRWYQLAWKDPMHLTGANVQAWTNNEMGSGGGINYYKLQYTTDPSPNANSTWHDLAVVYGTDSKNVTFTANNATALRVFFPAADADLGPGYVLGPGNARGPGLMKLLPTGTLANGGTGMNPADPKFNILATTIDKAHPENNLFGINPVISYSGQNGYPGRAPNENGANLLDGILDNNGPRTGWLATLDGTEAIICEFGNDVALEVHSVTLYGGIFATYLPATVKVYVTDDPRNLTAATFVGDAHRELGPNTGGVLTLNVDFDAILGNAVGKYVVLTSPDIANTGNGGHFLFQELAINARPPVPEPATMTLLALGGLALLRRRT